MRMSYSRWSTLWLLAALSVASITAAAEPQREVGLTLSSGRISLVEAAKKGDMRAVRALLKQQVDVNARARDGATALHWAAHRDAVDIADALIGAGADVRVASRYGVTPLSLAATNGKATMIERLLEAGADANTALPGGETALMTAARTGKVDAIKVLLAYGAAANARETTRGQTALMWAASSNNAAAIKVLVQGGAEIHARSTGPSAKVASAEPVYGVRRGPERVDSFTPLLFAVRRGQIDAVRALLEAGANVNDAAPDGTSALVVGIINAHWELAALLLDQGADPNADAQGRTALHQVARSRSLNQNRHPHPESSGNLSSLDLAKKLIEHGANVNARMTKKFVDGYRGRFVQIGATPLLLAAKGVDHELMRLLVANRADPTLTTELNSTLVMLTAGLEIMFPGEDSGTDEDALEAFKVALELGGDVNAVNNNGDTALHGAAFRGATSIVQLLVDNGAKLDARNKKGQTPLAIAHADLVSTVIQSAADVEELLRPLYEARGLATDVQSPEELRKTAFGDEKNQSLSAADPPGVVYWSASELKSYEKSLAANLNAQKVGSEKLRDFGNHSAWIAHREGNGLAEWHESDVDIFVVLAGEATLILGGEIIGRKPGEVNGTSIRGGVEYKLGAGDVVRLPAKMPHQMLVQPGRQIDYFVVKVTSP